MGSWRRLMVVGLLSGLFAASCVITSGDDDDDSGDDTTATGGSDDGTGGTATGGGGASFGGSPATGGTGGSDDGCSLEGVAGSNACQDCIRDNCCDEYDACADDDDCSQEWVDAQDCIIELNEDTGGAYTYEDVDVCVSQSAADDVAITSEMHELFICINTNETCAVACTGVYEPGAGGAGGAAGAPGEGGAGGGD
jgi:hypothetical protein